MFAVFSFVLAWLLVNYIMSTILLGVAALARLSRLSLLLVTMDARLRQTQSPQSLPLFYLGAVSQSSKGHSLGFERELESG